MEDATEKTPSIGISFNVPFVNQRTMVLQSFIERDCKPADLNALLDKLRGAADRQNAIVQLEETKKALAAANKEAERHAWRMGVAEDNAARAWTNGNRKGEMRLSPREEEAKRQAVANAATLKQHIDRLTVEVAEWQAKADQIGA